MSAALATPKPVRLLQLDVLRGIAVLLVMGYHLPALPILSNAGYLGVDLFFVLSGFLVSGLLFREIQSTGGVNLSRFYLRRALKI
jgi:peptidoglycan/LPS O-acetylase OafA/YrhL